MDSLIKKRHHSIMMMTLLINITLIILLSSIEAATVVKSDNNDKKNTEIFCKTKMDKCQLEFFEEVKKFKFNDYETSYYKLCSSDGAYMRFVDCIRNLIEQNQCKTHHEFCNKRGLKLSTYRFTWKASIVHDICYRTIPILDQEFFKNEKCISEVLNQPKWICDTEYYEHIKFAVGSGACQLWREFRGCVQEKVSEHCGKMTANISDYLMHVHASYFTKYSVCNLPGEHSTKCWIDLIDSIPRIPVPGAIDEGADQQVVDNNQDEDNEVPVPMEKHPVTSSSTMKTVKPTMIPSPPPTTSTTTTTTKTTTTTMSKPKSATDSLIDEHQQHKMELFENQEKSTEILTEQESDSNSLHSNLVREAKIDLTNNDHQNQHESDQQKMDSTTILENSSSSLNYPSMTNLILSLLFLITLLNI